MKTFLQIMLWLIVATGLSYGAQSLDGVGTSPERSDNATAFDAALSAQPKLLRISGRFDGSGRIRFTRRVVRYEHKSWQPPSRVLFDGEPWTKLDRTPAPWRDFGTRLDLSKAWIAKRKGRDVIALEHTPDGFDLYICDSPNGSGDYSVTLAIPRRK
ncbi:hypothetical protein EC9_05260 [Rosistilla ulvae]|uniref:Uncharacterized protein n=1 Tax=Rosistilla ulvae TaxID=1930277 RepID=A0A517LUR0_9BACT|nr:hypothetical protein [Rosistilla ulvae]QDS86365.1 hypothetical protein EC9_05260 [Rosistilla ulvae]